MTEPVDLKEIQEKLAEGLKPSGWYPLLRGFLCSSDFEKILNSLHDKRAEGKRFTPPLKQVFRAFETCPLDELKVVVIGQDPYPFKDVADGISFSCGNTGRPQASLRHIFKALDETVYKDQKVEHNPDLTRWANQGVLMLNKALTTEIDKIGVHMDIWRDFIFYVVDMLNLSRTGLVFLLMGKMAWELEDVIGESHKVIKVKHPASASYSGGTWDCQDCFNEVNRLLTTDKKIIW